MLLANEPTTNVLYGSERPEPLRLFWEDVTVDVTQGLPWRRRRLTLLGGVGGHASGGELLAILGPTGAGKSTLLDVLAGLSKRARVGGRRRVSGVGAGAGGRVRTAYVTQEDHLMGSLTVEETLWFHAHARLPEAVLPGEKRRRIEALLADLGLTGVRRSLVGTPFRRGISGGEKKRLSIAVEMITDPDVLFLDEPTTGLDAYSAATVMRRLAALAHGRGRMVVCTIHQPRPAIFSLFDRVYLLHAGRTVYAGPRDAMVPYFRAAGFELLPHANPADFALDVVLTNAVGVLKSAERSSSVGMDEVVAEDMDKEKDSMRSEEVELETFRRVQPTLPSEQLPLLGAPTREGGAPKIDLARMYERSGLASEEAAFALAHSTGAVEYASRNARRSLVDYVLGRQYASLFVTQLLLLCWRNAKNVVRTPTVSYVLLFQTLFNSLLCGLLYFDLGLSQESVQNRVGALFFILVGQAFSTFQSMALFLQERELFKRERASGVYRTTAYILGKQIVDTPLSIGFPLLYSLVVYWMLGLQSGLDRVLVFVVTVCMFSFTAHSINLFVGALSPSLPVAQIISPITSVVLMLGGGFFVNVNSLPVWFWWLKYISYFRYGFFILARNEFRGLVFDCDAGGPCAVRTGEEELSLLGVPDFNLWEYFGILLGMIVGIRVAAWLVLLVLHKEHR